MSLRRSSRNIAKPSDLSGTKNNISLLTDSQEELNKKLCNIVFGIDLLRETILSYVVLEKGKLSPRNAGICRLVSHSWLESVHKCLIKSGTHLFKIEFWLEEHALSNSIFKQFLNSYASSSRPLKSVPPFKLSLEFSDELYYRTTKQALSRCLLWCSIGLVTLNLNFICTYFPFTLPDTVHFPALQRVNLYFARCEDDDVNFDGFCREIATETQSLSSRCKKLTHLLLTDQSDSIGAVASAFKTLRLPDTITKLELRRGTFTADMEQLMISNTFPNLTDLRLNVFENKLYDDGNLVYRILVPVSATLQKLEIFGGMAENVLEKTPIHLPIMKRLKSLMLDLCNWKWGEGVDDVGTSLPVVTNIRMYDLAPIKLRRLVLKNQFESTEKLDISFSGNQAPYFQKHLKFSMGQLSHTFPHLSELSIRVTVPNDAPHIFKPIFEKMTQLKKLRLRIDEDYPSTICNPDHFWSLMFLGTLPAERSATCFSAITRMSDLSVLKLHLMLATLYFTSPSKTLPDDVFEYGFLRMPKLLNLTLVNMNISEDTGRKWKDAGRWLSLAYSP